MTPESRQTRVGFRVVEGDARAVLLNLPAQSVQCCVTSPPYFGLRDYGHDGQIGLEPTPEEFVTALVEVFREVRRVLRDDGTVWLNLGDSYVANGRYDAAYEGKRERAAMNGGGRELAKVGEAPRKGIRGVGGVKPKDLIGIPWMVAFALRADGWYLRSDIIWSKPNPMPESVTDRPTKAHEYLFLLSKGPRYFYDADAVRESQSPGSVERWGTEPRRIDNGAHYQRHAFSDEEMRGGSGEGNFGMNLAGRNKRSVWTVATQPYAGAHFATFPPKLIEPCVLAGCPEGGTVLDPFAGAGTTGVVALRHDRSFVGVELNPEYAELARNRIRDDAPLLNVEVAA